MRYEGSECTRKDTRNVKSEEFKEMLEDVLTGKIGEKAFYNNIKKFDYNLYLKRIKLVRKNNHTSQKELANYLNTTNSVISRYESGKTFILTLFLKEYAIFFNVSCDYLLGKKENETRI